MMDDGAMLRVDIGFYIGSIPWVFMVYVMGPTRVLNLYRVPARNIDRSSWDRRVV